MALIQEAQQLGIDVVGEIELFAEALDALSLRKDCKIIAITGTNGKNDDNDLGRRIGAGIWP